MNHRAFIVVKEGTIDFLRLKCSIVYFSDGGGFVAMTGESGRVVGFWQRKKMGENGDFPFLGAGSAAARGGMRETDASDEISRRMRNEYNVEILIVKRARKYDDSKPFFPGRCQELGFT